MTTKSLLLGAAVGAIGTVAFMMAHHTGLLSTPQVSADHHIATAAIAVIRGTEGNDVTGVVTFKEVNGGVEISAHINGLAPGKHGFHIHQLGDISAADGTSTGGHFNPESMDHAGPDSDMRHVGDMGNLDAGSSGHAMKTYVDKHVKLSGPNSVIGRAITIHAGEDDMTTQPTGAAGARVAVGVIGIAKGEESSN